ncbi:hypothetical protein [Candidatus Uabimicrobium sp. HlEnr_7]|uniref:hypothetical protein n=1 Tax=Candidatus Uabimicrobium helgolandensis TaxID=3095367 RepID=UPI003557AED9
MSNKIKLFTIFIAVIFFCGCRMISGLGKTTSYEIVDRRTYNKKHYLHEKEYIDGRREMVKTLKSLDLKTLEEKPAIGLAFSGGGIRSASFNLGILQVLEFSKNLYEIDYLSTVSGGSYIGAWYVSRLSQHNSKKHDRNLPGGVLYSSNDPADLLTKPSYRNIANPSTAQSYRKDPDPIIALRNKSGFIIDRSGSGTLDVVFSYVGGLFPNFFSKVLFNDLFWLTHDPFYFYKDRIKDTYLSKSIGSSTAEKENGILLERINPPNCVAPYLIVNATLGNAGCNNNAFPHYQNNKYYSKSPFEFTRDYCGAPGVGYVATKGFDKPVFSVEFSKSFPKKVHVVSKKVHVGSKLFRCKNIVFPLSYAVAISGAAVDTRVFGSWASSLDFLATPLNINLRYESYNFAQTYGEWYHTLYDDLLRGQTIDRVAPTINSNHLLLSDGGHYDNLGITALVKRRVRKIIVIDVEADPEFKCANIDQSMEALEKEGMEWIFDDRTPRFGSQKYIHKGKIISKSSDYKADIYYCKLNNSLLWDKQLPSFVKSYMEKKDDKNSFPYDPTSKQKYNWERLDAYRQFGFYIGSKLVDICKKDGTFELE